MQLIQPWPVNVVENHLENWEIGVSQLPKVIPKVHSEKLVEPDTQSCAFRTDFLLIAIKILKHSEFLKDLVENCIHYHVLWQLMGYRPLDPSVDYIWSLPSSIVIENRCYPAALQWPSLQERSPVSHPWMSSQSLLSQQTLLRLNFYSWNWKTLKSEPNIVFLHASLTHTTKLSSNSSLLCQRISLCPQFHALLCMHVVLQIHPRFDLPRDL